MQKCGYEG